MFNKTKYVVLDNGTRDEMFIFGETVMHRDVARSIGGEVVSAGFLSIDADIAGTPFVSCWGHSVSLKVESRPEADTKIASQVLGIDIDPAYENRR